MARFEIKIDHGATLSFVELREIIAIIDDHIMHRKRRTTKRRPRVDDDWWGYDRDFSFVEIQQVRPGSIILDVAVGTVVVWGIGAIALGLRRSRLGTELSRLGENAGNILSDGLDVVNSRLEDWSDANKRLRDRRTSVSIKQIPKEGEPPR